MKLQNRILIAIGFWSAVSTYADDKVKCSASCSKTINGQSVMKKVDCEYAIPPGISFSGADCMKQCTEKCVNSFGLSAPSSSVIKPLKK